jgi:hypothetical protein
MSENMQPKTDSRVAAGLFNCVYIAREHPSNLGAAHIKSASYKNWYRKAAKKEKMNLQVIKL